MERCQSRVHQIWTVAADRSGDQSAGKTLRSGWMKLGPVLESEPSSDGST